MPTFHFEAMDSAGQSRSDHVQAANADEAMRVLRTRGLFVVVLDEVRDGREEASGFESSVTASNSAPSKVTSADRTRPAPARWIGTFTTVVGVACLAAGLYGVLDAICFRIGAARATAVVVEILPLEGGDVLEFTASGRQYRVLGRGCFGALATSSGVRVPVDVVYPPDQPEKARLADFRPNFAVPLIMIALGSMFTLAGVLVLRRGIIPTTGDFGPTIDVS
jgi:hypothetical protein